MLGTAVARVLSAVTLVLIARQIGPEAAGQYSSSMAIAALTVILCSLGLDEWLLYRGGQSERELQMGLTSVLFLKLSLGVVWLVGLWLAVDRLHYSLLPWVLVLASALSVWMEEMAKTGWTVFKVHSRNDLTMVLLTAIQGLFLGITVWLIGCSVLKPEAFMMGRFLAMFAGAAASVLLAVRRIGLLAKPQSLWPAVKGAVPFGVSIALAMVYGRADLVIVAAELGKAAAGVYAPAITLTNALFLIPAAFYGVMVPTLGRSHVRDRVSIRKASVTLILGIAGLGLVLGSTLRLVSRPLILALYGAPFEASAEVLAVLGSVLILRCPNVALAAVLVAIGWQAPRMGVQAVSASLNVGLNMLIVHRLGVMGVARVYVVTEAVLLLGYLGLFLLWVARERGVIRASGS